MLLPEIDSDSLSSMFEKSTITKKPMLRARSKEDVVYLAGKGAFSKKEKTAKKVFVRCTSIESFIYVCLI